MTCKQNTAFLLKLILEIHERKPLTLNSRMQKMDSRKNEDRLRRNTVRKKESAANDGKTIHISFCFLFQIFIKTQDARDSYLRTRKRTATQLDAKFFAQHERAASAIPPKRLSLAQRRGLYPGALPSPAASLALGFFIRFGPSMQHPTVVEPQEEP
jgi:hypothetical protein